MPTRSHRNIIGNWGPFIADWRIFYDNAKKYKVWRKKCLHSMENQSTNSTFNKLIVLERLGLCLRILIYYIGIRRSSSSHYDWMRFIHIPLTHDKTSPWSPSPKPPWVAAPVEIRTYLAYALCRGFMCNYCMQHAATIASFPTCRKACNYCSVLHAIIGHETRTLVRYHCLQQSCSMPYAERRCQRYIASRYVEPEIECSKTGSI